MKLKTLFACGLIALTSSLESQIFMYETYPIIQFYDSETGKSAEFNTQSGEYACFESFIWGEWPSKPELAKTLFLEFKARYQGQKTN